MATKHVMMPYYPDEVPFEGMEELLAYDALNPEELVVAAQQKAQTLAIIGQHVSPRQALVIEAIYFDGESLSAIAIRTGLTPNQVFNAHHNGLKMLRKVKGLQQLLGGL